MASGNLSLPADELLLPAGDHPRSWAPPPPPPPQLDRPRMRSSPFPSSRDRTAYQVTLSQPIAPAPPLPSLLSSLSSPDRPHCCPPQAPEPAVPPQRFPDVEPLPAWPPHAPRTPFNPCELPSPRKSRRTLPAGPDASPDLTASLDSTPGLPTSPGGRERGPAVAPNYTCDGAARRCTAPGNVEPTVVYDAFWSDAQAYARGGASLTPPRSPPLGAGYAYGSLPAHARSAVAPGDFSRWHADQRAVTAAAAADLWRASLAPAAQTAAFGELAGDDGPRGVETALLQECETLMLAARHAGVPPPGVAPRNSSSQYRGVTKHRRTGRFEGHVW